MTATSISPITHKKLSIDPRSMQGVDLNPIYIINSSISAGFFGVV